VNYEYSNDTKDSAHHIFASFVCFVVSKSRVQGQIMLNTSQGYLRKIRVALLIMSAITLSGCGGPSAPPEAEGKGVSEPFLSAIREDRLDAAWDSTTAEFKSDMGRETFHRFANSHPVLKEPATFVSYQADTTNGIERGACEYQPAGNGSAKIRILVAREDKTWKVERLIVE